MTKARKIPLIFGGIDDMAHSAGVSAKHLKKLFDENGAPEIYDFGAKQQYKFAEFEAWATEVLRRRPDAFDEPKESPRVQDEGDQSTALQENADEQQQLS